VKQLRVLIADDHAPTRASVRSILEEDGRFTVCAEAADAPNAVQASIRERPDLCLLDIRMPGSGIAAAWEISARLPSTSLVVLTVSENDSDLFAALRAGASGYLLKDMNPERLPHALWDVAAGSGALPRPLLRRVFNHFRDPTAKHRTPIGRTTPILTSREWEVLEYLRDGLSTSQIARRLSVTHATVRSHRARIMHKLRAADQAELYGLLAEEDPPRA
jgi:DNA-binding NarL/FixJ family response regulator